MKIHMAWDMVTMTGGFEVLLSWHVIVYNELYKIIIMRYNKSVYSTKHK